MADTIVSVGLLDAIRYQKDIIVVTGWVLNGPLDPEKVKKAYGTLVETWPILSARLRINKKTQEWECHIPSDFSSRPRQIFKAVTIPGSIHKRYNYAKTSNQITCTPKEDPVDLYSQHGIRSVQDLLKKDIPMVQLQVTLFDDATILGLTTPHALFDGYGNKEIMNALCSILRGEKIPPLQEGDPFERYLHTQEPPETPPYWKVFSTWELLLFVACTLWDILWNRDMENREVFFPKEDVERIKAEAMDDLRKEHGDEKDVWISSSDALVAFCLKCMHPATASQTPFNMLYIANARRHLTGIMPKPYLHNATCPTITPTLPLSEISTLSLGALAYHIRQTVRSQTAPDAVSKWLRWQVANADRTTLFFQPTGAWNVATNWRDMKLMEVDFSGALPEAGAKDIKCVYVWAYAFQPYSPRNYMVLSADDPSGVWMGGAFTRRIWERKDGFGRFIRN